MKNEGRFGGDFVRKGFLTECTECVQGEGLLTEGRLSVMGVWGEGWHEVVVESEVTQVIRRQLGVPPCPCMVKWPAGNQALT